MPWLIKDQRDPSQNLFFVHVPRCGGTSLMKAHGVPTKALEGRSPWAKLGLKVFFHRYALLEKSNFPIFTLINAICLAFFVLGLGIRAGWWWTMYQRVANFLMAASFIVAICFSFVFTAPTIGRITAVRRTYLILIHYILLRFMESIEWCTGTNKDGYINHLTAHKLLHHGYLTPEQMGQICSLAIVRNPYTRMVSIYMYNRFGPFESFTHFVRSWYNMLKNYRETGEMEEWYTPCHGIPQFEYTHFQCKQIIQSIVKQEELKFLIKDHNKKGLKHLVEAEHSDKQATSSVKDLPKPVLDALLNMPHTNGRKTAKPWYEYYDQETLNLTYELYQHDFEIFDYSPELKQRPDLQSPTAAVPKRAERMQRNSVLASRQEILRRSTMVNSSRTSMLQEKTLENLGGRAVRKSTLVSSFMDGGKSHTLASDHSIISGSILREIQEFDREHVKRE